MKNTLLDVITIIVLTIIILFIAIFIYKTISKNDENQLEAILEHKPEQSKDNTIKDEKTDKLIVKEYEINGKKYEVIAILYIPTLEIEYPVLSNTSKELLKVSLNKYWGPNPNRPGNFCIVGHNYNTDQFFGKLNRIQKGEVIQLTDMSGKGLQYYVYDTYITDPDDTSCTSQLTDGKTEITLITCTKDFKQRFIVKARTK